MDIFSNDSILESHLNLFRQDLDHLWTQYTVHQNQDLLHLHGKYEQIFKRISMQTMEDIYITAHTATQQSLQRSCDEVGIDPAIRNKLLDIMQPGQDLPPHKIMDIMKALCNEFPENLDEINQVMQRSTQIKRKLIHLYLSKQLKAVMTLYHLTLEKASRILQIKKKVLTHCLAGSAMKTPSPAWLPGLLVIKMEWLNFQDELKKASKTMIN